MSEYVPPEVVNNDPNKGRRHNFYVRQSDGTPVVYVDFDFNLTTHPVTKDIVIRTNARAIRQSLENLVLTTAGEILMEPEVGGGVLEQMFGQNDAVTAYSVRSKIIETVKNHESRIELEDVEVFRAEDFHGLVVVIKYYIANQPKLIIDQIFLERVR